MVDGLGAECLVAEGRGVEGPSARGPGADGRGVEGRVSEVTRGQGPQVRDAENRGAGSSSHINTSYLYGYHNCRGSSVRWPRAEGKGDEGQGLKGRRAEGQMSWGIGQGIRAKNRGPGNEGQGAEGQGVEGQVGGGKRAQA